MEQIGKILQGMQINQVPAKPESTASKTLASPNSQENEFRIALLDKRLSHTSTQEYDQLIRRCLLKTGIRVANFPVKEELQFLFMHVMKNYSMHTIAEIDLAFDMAISGKLELTEKEVNPYENFSLIYFSRIINAYRAWAGQAHRHLPKETPEPQNNAAEIETIEWRELIQKDFSNFNTDVKIEYRLFPVEYYEQLVGDGFINPFLYKDFMDTCRQHMCKEVQKRITASSKEDDDSKYELEHYYSTVPLENELIDIRAGKKDREVMLFAKQWCVMLLFKQAKENKMNFIYQKSE